VHNCSCYQSRPCKYRQWSLFVISSYVITHLFCLYCSHVIFSLSWLTSSSFHLWLALCVPVSCVELHTSLRKDSSLLMARLAPIVSVYQCSSYLSFVASFLFCSFLCFLFSVSLFFSFLTKFESPNERNHRTGCGLPVTDNQ